MTSRPVAKLRILSLLLDLRTRGGPSLGVKGVDGVEGFYGRCHRRSQTLEKWTISLIIFLSFLTFIKMCTNFKKREFIVSIF
jgi:hypothetical protein